MRSKILLLLTSIVILQAAASTSASAQAPADTIYNPQVLYTAMPKVYEIAGITIEGAPNYDDYLILGYAGINIGDRVAIPGDDITNAVKRLMKQTLFAQARVSSKRWPATRPG